MTISYPVQDERAAFRRILESAAQIFPVTAALAHMYGYSNPSAFEQDMEAFLRQLADTVNDHGERMAQLESQFAPRAAISALAAAVALEMLKLNATGRNDAVDSAVIIEKFPQVDQLMLEEAIAELQHLGYAESTSVIGRHNARVRPTTAMFLAFDKAATGNDARADAVDLAKLLLADPSAANFLQLAPKLGWPPRRINPALQALHGFLPGAAWSREIHATYAETQLLVTANERRLLRQLAESGRID